MIRARHIRTTLLCCLAAMLLAAAPAHASKTQTMLFEAPNDLLNAKARPRALEQLQSLGVHALRIVLYWQSVAPAPNSRTRPAFDATDPSAYNWGQYDPLIASARALGWEVVLTVTGPVPRWATPGGRDFLTRPSPLAFQQFMTAVGRHYGDYVKTFAIWNEPNEPMYLLPQFVGGQPASPLIYRGLFEAGYAGLKASGNFGGMRVLMGETAPIGTPKVVAPLVFLRGALCLNDRYQMASTCSKLPADGYAHHAYTKAVGPFWKPPSPNAVTIGVLGRLVTALDRAGRAGAIMRGMPIYLTEFGIQSYPDPISGVPLAQQPEYYAIAEKMAWSNARVRSFSQYLLSDDPARSGNLFQRWEGFQSGIEFASGKLKPSYHAFPVPLVVTRSGGSVSLWGKIRAAAGVTRLTVEVSDRGKAFKRLLSATTNGFGYWRAGSAFRSGRRWRVVWTSPTGTVYTGPPIRAYTASGALQR